ncbi:MAG: hypothetical protein GX542_00425 [Rhodococcus sp.]|nr:hypothetical protein [Rhodococcus sp. (in: high G+C Gram-positive bacteria)]
MAETSWEMSAFEFVAAWNILGGTRLPFPLAFREYRTPSEQDLPGGEDASHQLQGSYGNEFFTALELLANPAVRVAICGFEGPHSEGMIRAHAGIGRDLSSVVVQVRGSRPNSGGKVEVSLHQGMEAITQLVKVMPDMPAGTRNEIAIPRTRSSIAERAGSGSLPADMPKEAKAKSDEAALFFSQPHSSFGEIAVNLGSAVHSRKPTDGTILQWIDYVDDGRYLIRHTEHIVARPVSPPQVVAEIEALVDQVLKPQPS